jgi:bacterioferritin-associated ferredoxin
VYRDCFRVEHLPQRRHAVSTADVVVKSTALPAEKLAQSNEGIERLEHAIGQLLEDDQKIIRAVMAGPCSGDELAEILGVQASAAHMRKSRAIRRLAAILNPPSNDAQEDESEDSSGIAHLKKAKAKQPRKKATTTTACMTVEAPRAVLFHPEDVVQPPEPESTPGHAEEPIVLPLAPVALRPRPLRADWTGVFLSILG